MSAMIYVACLAAYNGGALHGSWIEASADVDEMHEAVQEVLATSPRAWDHEPVAPALRAQHRANGNAAAITRRAARLAHAAGGPGAPTPCTEEWAIHDHEGLPGIGEYTSLDEIAAMVALMEEHGADLVEAMLEHHPGDLDYVRECLAERHCGSASSREDWAFDHLEDQLSALPESLRYFFDFAKFAREAEMDWAYFVDVGETVHVFSR